LKLIYNSANIKIADGGVEIPLLWSLHVYSTMDFGDTERRIHATIPWRKPQNSFIVFLEKSERLLQKISPADGIEIISKKHSVGRATYA
jgi:hypothetical protein